MINQLGYYLKANGAICKIKEIDKNDIKRDNCYDDVNKSYYPDGSYLFDEINEKDIIAYIPDALQFEIVRIIKAYHTTDRFRNMIDNCYKNHLENKGE